MKKTISILLAALMLFALAACGGAEPKETSTPETESAAHYLKALSYVNGDVLDNVDYFDAQGHILGDEVYSDGALVTVEEFSAVEGFNLDLKELEDNEDVVSTEYKELYARTAEEGSEYKSTGKVFAFGYDANNHMRMAKVFALSGDGAVLFTYVIYYQLDEHGNFTGWTHMTEEGKVLLEMNADLSYDGDQLVEADYHYTRYGQISYTEGYPYEELEPVSADSHVVFEY
ncbi:MAG: hypothetical protein IJH52_01125 [Oscillospiraceae bacterium]|nr:hypothetical protein [Oscillospiraceae bacterium]MBQ6403559.1 hypothetical protein [Oscillospiraceae bacterium]